MKKNRLLIAGPCSAESALQMKRAAALLSLTDERAILRAGCWKPRTAPGGFEGHGENGLRWLKEAAALYGLQWITEAGTAAHAALILRHGGTQLWIGARTTADPFAVEEIAAALEASGVQVFIKNPPQPDVKLWTGAVERFARRNVAIGGLIHRGFKVWPGTEARNVPLWKLLDDARAALPGVPVITDPSHIGGRTDLVKKYAEEATALNVDGLMIEMHPSPAAALTDREQQLTPVELQQLLHRLKRCGQKDQLELLRLQIDETDEMLWSLLAERAEIVSEISNYKEMAGMCTVQAARKSQVMENYLHHAARARISREEAMKLFQLVHSISVRSQNTQRRIPAV